MFYNPRSSDEFEEIADLGEIDSHFLSHCHEVDGILGAVERFDSKLCCHALVMPYIDTVLENLRGPAGRGA